MRSLRPRLTPHCSRANVSRQTKISDEFLPLLLFDSSEFCKPVYRVKNGRADNWRGGALALFDEAYPFMRTAHRIAHLLPGQAMLFPVCLNLTASFRQNPPPQTKTPAFFAGNKFRIFKKKRAKVVRGETRQHHDADLERFDVPTSKASAADLAGLIIKAQRQMQRKYAPHFRSLTAERRELMKIGRSLCPEHKTLSEMMNQSTVAECRRIVQTGLLRRLRNVGTIFADQDLRTNLRHNPDMEALHTYVRGVESTLQTLRRKFRQYQRRVSFVFSY